MAVIAGDGLADRIRSTGNRSGTFKLVEVEAWGLPYETLTGRPLDLTQDAPQPRNWNRVSLDPVSAGAR